MTIYIINRSNVDNNTQKNCFILICWCDIRTKPLTIEDKCILQYAAKATQVFFVSSYSAQINRLTNKQKQSTKKYAYLNTRF